MIQSKKELKEFILLEGKNYQSQIGGFRKRFWMNLFSNPICEQKYIWLYIKTLRLVEYYENLKNRHKIFLPVYVYYLHKLRKYSHITGYQIPPHIISKGLTIWHWGPIIINPSASIGENCTIYPGVLIGHKNPGEGCAVIGNNVFIGAGTKIIGRVKIGNNVITCAHAAHSTHRRQNAWRKIRQRPGEGHPLQAVLAACLINRFQRIAFFNQLLRRILLVLTQKMII